MFGAAGDDGSGENGSEAGKPTSCAGNSTSRLSVSLGRTRQCVLTPAGTNPAGRSTNLPLPALGTQWVVAVTVPLPLAPSPGPFAGIAQPGEAFLPRPPDEQPSRRTADCRSAAPCTRGSWSNSSWPSGDLTSRRASREHHPHRVSVTTADQPMLLLLFAALLSYGSKDEASCHDAENQVAIRKYNTFLTDPSSLKFCNMEL